MISASVVLFHTSKEELEKVIRSYAPGENRYLFLIDNSQPASKEELADVICSPYIEYIHNDKNLGYGAAHNIGIRKAIERKSEYHIVLNPDISFQPTVIDELIAYADNNPDVVYLLPKVVYPSGEIQYLCKLLPTPFDLFARRFLPNVGPIKKTMNGIV